MIRWFAVVTCRLSGKILPTQAAVFGVVLIMNSEKLNRICKVLLFYTKLYGLGCHNYNLPVLVALRGLPFILRDLATLVLQSAN